MVSDVSAMLVATTHFLPGGPPALAAPGAGSKMSCCFAGGKEE